MGIWKVSYNFKFLGNKERVNILFLKEVLNTEYGRKEKELNGSMQKNTRLFYDKKNENFNLYGKFYTQNI